VGVQVYVAARACWLPRLTSRAPMIAMVFLFKMVVLSVFLLIRFNNGAKLHHTGNELAIIIVFIPSPTV
jgi:hypothetical protein